MGKASGLLLSGRMEAVTLVRIETILASHADTISELMSVRSIRAPLCSGRSIDILYRRKMDDEAFAMSVRCCAS